MSHFGPEYFNCKHKNLTQNKLSKGTYVCDRCNKDFVMISAKHDPFIPHMPLPNLPQFPSPRFPHTMPYYHRKYRRGLRDSKFF